MIATAHHPIFDLFETTQRHPRNGHFGNFLGVRTRRSFFAQAGGYGESYQVPCGEWKPVARPTFDEEYFEWVDLLEAVVYARGLFVMMELGAGYGRWVTNAVAALRLHSDLPYRVLAVEADPLHVQYMRRHFRDNGIPTRRFSTSRAEVVEAAVAGEVGTAWFDFGPSDAWYGQSLWRNDPPREPRARRLNRRVGERGRSGSAELQRVRTITLSSLLDRVAHVDLLDIDVQGVEHEVLGGAATAVDAKVKRVHIGTHSEEAEASLRDLFTGLGWIKVNDYSAARENATPWGVMRFVDGVQTWVNPRLAYVAASPTVAD